MDVFAKDEKRVPASVCICECKHWNYKVPKSVVHSFRTVVTDFGANFGYLISKSGYQKGAFAAAENSNIKLFTWDEFLKSFEIRWLESMIEKLDKEGLSLREYTDLLSERYIKQISEEKREHFNAFCLGLNGKALFTSKILYDPPNGIGFKSHVDAVIDTFIKKNNLKEINSYSDFFRYMFNFCNAESKAIELEFNLT